MADGSLESGAIVGRIALCKNESMVSFLHGECGIIFVQRIKT